MDQNAFDEYSIIHFSIGLLAYQSGFSFITLVIFYSIFKIFGNTSFGINIIDKYVSPIFGYKLFPESYKNIISDLGICLFGWFLGYFTLDKEFNFITTGLVGILLYFWFRTFINNYPIATIIIFILLGLFFRQFWFMLIGITLGYVIHNLKIVTN